MLPLIPCRLCRCKMIASNFPANSKICRNCVADVSLMNGKKQKPYERAKAPVVIAA